jgi:hypothetical protein
MMIEFAHSNSYLPGKIDERDCECAKGDHEQESNPALVLNFEECASESHDHENRHRDTSDDGPEDGSLSPRAASVAVNPS